MNNIELKIYESWRKDRPHVSTYGKDGYHGYRDVVIVRDDGSKLYSLWGTRICFMNKRGTFYFHVTDRGNVHSYTCMSQTSKSRINALLPYGSITQKNYCNYYNETKLECCNWYKLVGGEVVKIEAMPNGLLN